MTPMHQAKKAYAEATDPLQKKVAKVRFVLMHLMHPFRLDAPNASGSS